MLRALFFFCLFHNSFFLSRSNEPTGDFYSFQVQDIHGQNISLEKYRGTVSLVVNVASLCGYTDSTYRALKRLQDILGYNNKFQVLAFPVNQFGDQEPHDDEVIYNFAKTNYDIEFPMFSKIDVLGENAHPAFKNLISQSSVHPDWNFYKYLVGPDGKVLKAWSTKVTIEDIFESCKSALDLLLAKDNLPNEAMPSTESTLKDEL